jgi:hypothetical protein
MEEVKKKKGGRKRRMKCEMSSCQEISGRERDLWIKFHKSLLYRKGTRLWVINEDTKG